MQEQLEQRLAMAVTPTVAWSSYLGNAGVQSIEGAWVAPDDTVFVKWSGGPGMKSGLDRFDSNLIVDNTWATSLGRVLTGSGNAQGVGEARADFFTVRPLGITDIQFGKYLDGNIEKDAIYIVGQTNQPEWVRNGYDRTAEFARDTNGRPLNRDEVSNNGRGIQEGFVAKLSLAGTGLWSTYLGGNGRDWVNSFTVASNGNDKSVYITGVTRPNVIEAYSSSYYNTRELFYSFTESWIERGFDTTAVLPELLDLRQPERGFRFRGGATFNSEDAFKTGWTVKLNDAASTSENPQNIWSTYLSPTGHVMKDAAGTATDQTVTYAGKQGDFVWVDSQGYSWTVVDGQRLFKMAPDGRLDEVRSFRLLPKITAKIVSGNSLYVLGQDRTGKNVVQKVILEDTANPENNWTTPWTIDLGDVAPSCMAIDPAGDRVYLGGTTAPGQDYAGLVKANGQVLAPIGTRQGPTDGYLIQLTTSTGSPDYMMYIGGDGQENVTAIAARSDGVVWVMGDTDSRLNSATGRGPDAVNTYWIKGGVTGADVSYSGDRDGFVVAVKTDDRFSLAAVAGKANIASGDQTPSKLDGTDFGKTALGSPLSQTFTVRNSGNGRLSLTNLALPAGYTLVGNFPTGIDAGQSATFTIRLDAEPTTPLGVKTGTLSFTTSDITKPTYSFSLQGEVVSQMTPEISVANVAVVEGNSGTTPATFTVSLSAAVAAGQTASVDYRIAAGTATAGRDYTVAASTGTLTFGPGETTKTVVVNVVGDVARESNETFQLVLSNPIGATITAGTGTATATITDDDTTSGGDTGGTPSITADALRIVEGSTGTTTAMVTLRLSAATSRAVSVQYVTSDATARAGSDYTRTSGRVTFAANETVKTISIPVIADTTSEADETFRLGLSSPVNATLGTTAVVITIVNDDTASAAAPVTVSNVSIREGNTGRPAMVFTLSLARAATATTTYTVRTVDGTARAGRDYVGLREGSTVVFRAGQRSATVVVNAIANTRVDGDRSFTLDVLFNGSSVGRGTGTIRDDDRAAAFASMAFSVATPATKSPFRSFG
jgi:hypothetical protein